MACASSRKRRKSSLSSAFVSAADEVDLGSERGGGGRWELEALRALVLTELRLDDMEVDWGKPRRWPLVWVGDEEMRPDGAADVEGATARSCVQAKGMVESGTELS